jgi:hypothetical protein
MEDAAVILRKALDFNEFRKPLSWWHVSCWAECQACPLNPGAIVKTYPALTTSRVSTLAGAIVMAMASAGVANATLISQTFTSGVEGGIVTFDDNLGSNQFRLIFNNTSSLWNGVITGIVFNVEAAIKKPVSIFSFKDGNGADIAGWTVGVDINNETTPGNTVFDIAFETTNGINGGIYNKGVATNFANVVPDIATLILTVTDPDPWTLASIGDDSILRMQRTGATGAGSLKIDTSTSSSSSSSSSTSGGATSSGQTSNGGNIPEPGSLSLLGAGGLLGSLLVAYRRRRQYKSAA